METNSFSVLCYIRNSRLDQKGKASLFLRITVNMKRAEFSIKRKVKPENWNSIKGRMRGTSQMAKVLNHYIDELESKAYAIHSKLVKKKKPFTSELIKNKLLNKEESYKTLLTIYDEHNSQIEELIGLDYSYGAYRRHIRTRNHLQDFVKQEYKRDDYFVKEIDLKFINRFHHYLVTKKIGNQNTKTKYVVNFKKIMRIAFANNWVNKDPFFHWKAKWKKVEREVLTELELCTMMKKEFKMKRLEQVRDIFVFCCFTGLAYTDVQKLSQDHIVLKMNGTRWIKINRSKTDSRSTIPLLPAAEEIIKKYADHPITLQNGLLLPVISNQRTNAYLKEIAERCDIEKHLTFHLARHTFATTVTLANGIPIESVSKMLGHQSLKTTQIYAKVIDQKLKQDMDTIKDKYKLS
ncbi:site-specific integrase [Ulvibacterium marinum]|uniref:Site-specific integrase n=1 Tax=Ulvibacterium marinum TaxID=2419782 RepID=A0A3B0C2L5_9FLAO|nr:site-specific integrase [Ulvibacterium marinum]RKN80293.1 site-specific integrase [Ulvibacterium marinum]